MPEHIASIVDGGYPNYDAETSVLEAAGVELVFISAEELPERCPGCTAILARQADINAELISKLPKLKVIARYGTGVDNVDIPAATKAGVAVVNVVGYANDDVSAHAVALLLAASHFITAHHLAIQRGEWDVAERFDTHRFKGRTAGLLGLGGIARAAVPMLQGLGLSVIAFDPYIKPETTEALNARLVDFDTLLAESHYISVHAPLTDETRHVVDAAAFEKMRDGVIIVNTSRGPLIDEAALIEALKSGKVTAAGLDVFETEPLPTDSPLREMENVVLSDHASWFSIESRADLQRLTAEAAAAVLTDKPPASILNPEVLA